MSLIFSDNISYQGKKPLDARIVFQTFETMVGMNEASLYDGLLAFCKSDGLFYSYVSTRDVVTTEYSTVSNPDGSTKQVKNEFYGYGKWRPFGGISADDYYTKAEADERFEKDIIILTKAEYDALTTEEKESGQTYLVTGYDDIASNLIPTSTEINTASTDSTYPTSAAVEKRVTEVESNTYKKVDTYSKTEVNVLIGNMTNLKKKIVDEVPNVADAEDNIIYMVASETEGTYNQYTVADGKMVSLGDTSMNLDEYVKKETIDDSLLKIQRNGLDITTFKPDQDSVSTANIKVPVVKVNGSENTVEIYAPITSGEVSQILTSKGENNAPSWIDFNGGNSKSATGFYAPISRGSDYQFLIAGENGIPIWQTKPFYYGITNSSISYVNDNSSNGWKDSNNSRDSNGTTDYKSWSHIINIGGGGTSSTSSGMYSAPHTGYYYVSWTFTFYRSDTSGWTYFKADTGMADTSQMKTDTNVVRNMFTLSGIVLKNKGNWFYPVIKHKNSVGQSFTIMEQTYTVIGLAVKND